MTKKLLLVNPPDCSQGGVSNPVLGLLYLASFVRFNTDFEVDYIDGFLEGWLGIGQKIDDFKPDVVGSSMLTPGRHNTLNILKMAHDRGAITVTGGPHASIMADQIITNYNYVDHVITGEGEQALVNLLRTPLQPRIIQGQELDLSIIPFPAWDLAHLESDKYIGNMDIRVPIISSRGCTGNCTFCSTHRVWKKYRVRSAEDVTSEIEYIINLSGKKHFVFEDDSLSCNLAVSKETLKAIIGRKLDIKFFATMRADGIDEELVQLLKKAGCYGVSIGFESGSQEVLDLYNKHITVEQNIWAAKIIRQSGLQLCALMILHGLKATEKTNNETNAFLREIQADNIGTLSQLWVLPGTKIYAMMKKNGFINDDFWLGPEPFYVYKGELDRIL